MKTIQLFNIAPTYESQRIKSVKLSPKARYMQLGSPYGMIYGDPGEAGAEGGYSEEGERF